MITLHGPNGTPIYIAGSNIVTVTRGIGVANTEVSLSNGKHIYVTETPSVVVERAK